MHKVNFYLCLRPKTTGRATALSNVLFFFQRLTINIIVISQKTVLEFDNRNRPSSLGCTKTSNIFTFPGKLKNILEHDTI